jgi:hypothetical protein
MSCVSKKKWIWRGRALFILLVAIAGITLPMEAQFSTGGITGHVIDQSGQAVVGATVVVQDLTTQAIQTATTQESGNYAFPSLPPRPYQNKVSAPGFSQEVANVTLGITEQLTRDFQLRVGQANETVTVNESSDTVSLDREDSTVSELVTESQLASLPSNTRNFLNLVILGPGAQPGGDLINHSSNGLTTPNRKRQFALTTIRFKEVRI